MKHVDTAQLATAAPVMIKMTRRDKLRHWARLVRGWSGGALFLYHNLEHMPPDWLKNPANLNTGSYMNAFALALADPTFKTEGLSGNSIADVQKFMELSQSDVHEFSCDCGGHIGNADMAQRIERIAG